MLKSINPYTGEEIGSYLPYTASEIDSHIDLAHQSFLTWRNEPLSVRCSYFKKVALHLEEHKRTYAELMSREMGKPVTQGVAEIEKCAWLCNYYSQHGEAFLNPKMVETDAAESFVLYEPLGVILGVMPWNYPFWQVFRFAVPTILSGNTVLLKHASNVMGCAQAIERVFVACGFPDGVFQQLVVGSEAVEGILSDNRVLGVSLTGSEKAGKSVASIAGREIKTSLLELGGSNAFIVMNDADLDKAVRTAINARYQNTGQSCIAAKRFLLHEHIADQFLIRFKEVLSQLKTGDPLQDDTYIGVLAREDLAEVLEAQMERSLDAGAELLYGGERKGAYFHPAVMRTRQVNVPVMQEETFGPLVCAYIFRSLDEAIAVSNSSKFGLGVSIFTGNTEQIKKRIPEFNEGAVFINEMVKSDPRLPFGGVKYSGYGRELGLEGIRAFVNVKTVYIGC